MDIKITADIIDYLGKYDNGVLVLLSLNCNNSFTESTLYYSDKILVLTVDESVEKEIGSVIELWPGYRELLISILKRVVPYNEIINRLDDIDVSQYYNNEVNYKEGEDIDDDEIKTEE